MTRLCMTILLVLLFGACGTSTAASPSAAALAAIDLESLVIQPGDLPPMNATPQPLLPFGLGTNARPGSVTSFSRLLMHDDYVLGSIYVTIYTRRADATRDYDEAATAAMKAEQYGYTVETPAIGERAMLVYRTPDEGAQIILQRCHASLALRFPASQTSTHSREALLAYAQRLDTRLTPQVCP